MKLRKHLAAAVAVCLSAATFAVALDIQPAVAAGEPVVLNDGGQNAASTQYLESQSLSNGNGTNTLVATFLVQHPAGRKINTVRLDSDNNGTDNTANNTATNVAVTSQFYSATGGANSLQTDRVTVSANISPPQSFSCPTFGTPSRRFDSTVRFRVVDDLNVASLTTLNQTLHWVAGDSNCSVSTGSTQDYPYLKGGMTQSATEINAGGSISYTFQCNDFDVDFFSTDDSCDKANVRLRRLNDGAITTLSNVTGIGDDTNKTFSVTFPSRGYYVVEGQLANENGSFPDTGGNAQGWWRFGNAVVNDAAATSLSGSIGFTGSQPSSPPSVNPGTVSSASATVADTNGGVEVIEWDADNNGTYERLDSNVPSKVSNAISVSTVSGAQLLQSISTATPGLKTVNAKITDTGAIDAADNIRRQLTFSGQLRVNALPVANAQTVTATEDTPVTISLVGTDADNQPDALTYAIASGPPASAGTLGSVSGSSVTFTPTANFNGSTSFTFNVSDGTSTTVGAHATSANATVTINVASVNDTPLVDSHSATTLEDNPVTIIATGSDVEDGTNLTYSVQSGPANGTASCANAHPSHTCTYNPASNFNGTDTFTVRGTDSGGLFSSATYTVNVTAVNDAPVAVDDTVSVPEDSVSFPITLSASDVDSLALTFSGPSNPVDDVHHGTLTCAGDTCFYTPTHDYNGPDSFTFTVSDGLLSDTGTITIDVTNVNDAPIATDVPDAQTNEDTPLSIALGGTDVDNDPVTISSAANGAHGTVTIDDANHVTYSPDLNFNGIDTFQFTVTDGNGGFDNGTVTVTVLPVNDAPVLADQSFSLDEDSNAIFGVAASDVDGDALAWSVVTPPTHGHLYGVGPDVVYQPDHDFNGTDTFVLSVDDGSGEANSSDTGLMTVVVNPVNDQPDAHSAVVTTNEDTGLSITLTASDVDGDTPSFTVPGIGPFHGSLTCSGASCDYSPTGDFNGSDLFTFSVDDGHGGSDSASITIVVNAVNDVPTANNGSVATLEDTAVAVNLVAADVDGDILSYSTGAPAHGTLAGVAPNLTYMPTPNYNGSDSFAFSALDGHGGTASAVVSVTVAAVNDAPIASGGSASTPEDTPVTFSLGGSDVDGDTLTFSVTTPPATGTLSCDVAGACSYAPASNFNGVEYVGYSVTDGTATSNGVFTIMVDPVNDPPTAASTTAATSEDTALPMTLVANDTEGDALTYSIVAPPAHGSLACTTNSCVYTPSPNYFGNDAFTWSADDGHPGAANATVSITVTPVNDTPVALHSAIDIDEDTPTVITLMATDADGDALTYAIQTTPAHGSVTVSGNHATYTPALDYNGADSFTFRATDPSGAFSIGQVTITVNVVPLIATKLAAEPAVAKVTLKMVGINTTVTFAVLTGMRARLTVPTTGLPLAGRSVSFRVGNQLVRSAITSSTGWAGCDATSSTITALLNLGYTASFDGDNDYSASSAKGSLATVIASIS